MRAAELVKTSSKFHAGEAVKFAFKFPSEAVLRSINALLARILSAHDIVFLLDSLTTILRELVFNAIKANAKRVYFKNLDLNIDDPVSYEKGMKGFKEKIAEDIYLFKKDLKESDHTIRITIQKEEDSIQLKISNNAPLLPAELKSIEQRKTLALQCEDFNEVFDMEEEETEGAGMGILLIILLLKNTGIGVDSFKIEPGENKTTALITIPLRVKPGEVTSGIKDIIVKQVYGLPTFPAHIAELQRMCGRPDADIDRIAEKVTHDPSLASGVLKISNSAGFSSSKKIENIHDAIMVIGLKNLNAILISTGARKMLDTRFSSFEHIWDHCNKTAFYARQIALRYKLTAELENAFLAGLLHDLGKIVLLSTHLAMASWISDIVKNRKIRTSTVMEELSLGISHSSIGKLIAEKWNFPDYLLGAIEFHHSPLAVDDAQRDLVFVVYLANMLCGIDAGNYSFYYIEEEVLERFSLLDEEEFNKFHGTIKKKYDEL
ncbi:MAG: HDOD domain-containing protein [bacterium]|nr:HDOD domain-containing protein [bacterium]